MLRIVGVQRSHIPAQEFVLLQNQGAMRVCLRGLVLLSEAAVERGELNGDSFLFSDAEIVPPGLYVMVSTGPGTPHWSRTKDGAHVYHAYMGRRSSAWSRCPGPIHVLSPQHSFVERGEALMLR